MATKVNALNEHYLFIRDLITAYRQLPLLWDRTNPKHTDRYERSEAYEILVLKVREYYPEADEDFVRLKIQSLRNTFRKEHRKVIKSKETATKPEQVYKPTLWYYNLFSFIVNDNLEQSESLDGDEDNQNPVDIPLDKLCYWSIEHTALLINLYKLYPCLYSTSDPGYRSRKKREEAIKQVTNELINVTGKAFKEDDVLRKMRTLRGQYLRELIKSMHHKKQDKNFNSSWGFYEMMEFLKPEYDKLIKRKYNNCIDDDDDDDDDGGGDGDDESSPAKLQRFNNDTETDDSANEEMIVISRESPPIENNEADNDQHEQPITNDKDLFDTIARNVAHQLREMNDAQRSIAERLIREILYHGTMENLTVGSKLIL